MSDDSSSGCAFVLFDVYIWNAIAIIYFTFQYVPNISPVPLHNVTKLVIGIILTVIYFILVIRLRVVRWIFNIVTSVFWGCLGAYGLQIIVEYDYVWLWFFRVVLTLVCLFLHWVYSNMIFYDMFADSGDNQVVSDSNGDILLLNNKFTEVEQKNSELLARTKLLFDGRELPSDFAQAIKSYSDSLDRLYKQYNSTLGKYKNRSSLPRKAFEKAYLILLEIEKEAKIFEEALNEYVANENVYNSYNKNTCQRKTEKNNTNFNPFAGCHDLESLKRRYKNLCKAFHPDMDEGDTNSMQFINAEYERLLKQYK